LPCPCAVQLTRGRQGLAWIDLAFVCCALARDQVLFPPLCGTTVNRSIALSKASRSRTLRRTRCGASCVGQSDRARRGQSCGASRARSRSRRQAATQPERIVIAAATQHFPLCFFTCRCNQSRAGAIFWTRTLRPHACSALLCSASFSAPARIASRSRSCEATGGGKALDRPRPELRVCVRARVRTPMWLNFNFKLTWPYVCLCPPVEMSTFFFFCPVWCSFNELNNPKRSLCSLPRNTSSNSRSRKRNANVRCRCTLHGERVLKRPCVHVARVRFQRHGRGHRNAAI
jgi:hypothetical protein